MIPLPRKPVREDEVYTSKQLDRLGLSYAESSADDLLIYKRHRELYLVKKLD